MLRGQIYSPQEDVMENMVGQCLLYTMLLALLAWPLGIYMGKVMDGEPLWLQKVLAPCERGNTMTQIYSRPSPDALLAQLQQAAYGGTGSTTAASGHTPPLQHQHGMLKIFFGYAAGVGKTYSMLRAAHAAQELATR